MSKSFLSERTKLANLIYSKDWTNTTLGPIKNWSTEFKNTLNIMLSFPVPCAIFWGPEYKMFYNDAYMPILNGKHPNCLGKNAGTIWVESWQEVGADFRDVYYSGKIVVKEERFIPILIDNKLVDKYWDYTLFPLFEHSSIVGVFNRCVDVTERVNTRLKLEKQYKELEAIYNTSSIALAVVDVKDFKYIQVNERLTTIIGKPASEIEGKCIFEFGEDAEGIKDALTLATSGQRFTKQVKTKFFSNPNRETKWQVEYIPLFDNNGNVEAVITVGIELTD